jgi:hypothetical protein
MGGKFFETASLGNVAFAASAQIFGEISNGSKTHFHDWCVGQTVA